MVQRNILCDGTPDVPLHVSLCRLARIEAWSIASIAATYWRCYVVTAGRAHLQYAGETVDLVPGRAFLVAPGTAASTGHDAPFTKAYLHFAWRPAGRVVPPGLHECAVPVAVRRALMSVAAEPGSPDAAQMLCLTMEALARIGLAGLPISSWPACPTPGPVVAQALGIIAAEMAYPPSNLALARRLGLHPHSLVRAFVRETGESPQRASLRLRLEEAARRLEGEAHSIEAIAEACGFCDRHHFTRVFTRWRCSPAAYRRRHLG